MIICHEDFNFIDKMVGVTKDGEKFISVNVLSKDNKKFNFISKDASLIDKLASLKLQRFCNIKLVLQFQRVFNREKRTSYWTVNLVDVE